MRQEILTGVERRRRWRDEQKLAIVSEVGVAGASVADVARRHDVSRPQIYQWRRELARKGLLTVEPAVFLPVALQAPSDDTGAPGAARPVEVRLANGRSLAVQTDVPAAALQRLIRLVESAWSGRARACGSIWPRASPTCARASPVWPLSRRRCCGRTRPAVLSSPFVDAAATD